jgi:hypothetical protein
MRPFFAGVATTVVLELGTLAAFGFAPPEPPPAAAAPAKVARDVTFRVVAPKGYQDLGRLVFDCAPRLIESSIVSGKKPPSKGVKP